MMAIKTHRLDGLDLPLVHEPEAAPPSLDAFLAHVTSSRDAILGELAQYGAVLFRGFPVATPEDFQSVFRVLAPELASYVGGDSPRAVVSDRVYTSTSYPPALPITLHNEMSYSRDYPRLIAFYCDVAPEAQGETPLADGRRVLAALPAELVTRWRARRIRYVQNLHAGKGLGKSWRETFETDDRARVETILTARGAELAWKDDGGLRVAEVTDPFVKHPVTGEEMFFTQAHQWHVSSLDPKTRDALLRLVKPEDLYHTCTFGDGSPIDEADLVAIRQALDAATVAFPWRPRDVLVVDNVRVLHGRRPFKGPRRILVAMGGPARA